MNKEQRIARANAKEVDRIKAEDWWLEQENEFLRRRIVELEAAISAAKGKKDE